MKIEEVIQIFEHVLENPETPIPPEALQSAIDHLEGCPYSDIEWWEPYLSRWEDEEEQRRKEP